MSTTHWALILPSMARSGLCLLAGWCFSSAVLAAPPEIVLPNGPMANASVHSNLLLDLSVEYPTSGASYRAQDYIPTRRYIGYFDSTMCYQYTLPSTYSGGLYDVSNDDNKYFQPVSAADVNHNCSGKFSGNFMNWATSSAIDILRLTLTGGDRIIDEVGKTILQRAVLHWGFYNYFDFPLTTFSGTSTTKPGDVTPFSTDVIYTISCKNRVMFSSVKPVTRTVTPTTCDELPTVNPDKLLGEYQVRVEVCSSAEGPRRLDLCKRYGTNYKPEGEIQKNADQMHFAVMSYLYDNDAARYGGVLRAPMRYVGQYKYDQFLKKSANPNPEWDAQTGVFLVDPIPDGVKTGASGVINYLNKFGRLGNYKAIDPVSELFYEGVRYLQGLPPTKEAVANVTTEMTDGFPVITKWEDPIVSQCQKNAIILIADANTHADFYIPGNAITFNSDGPRPVDSTSTPPLNVMDWTQKVGEMETATHGVDMTTRPNLSGLSGQKTGAGNTEASYYLAGLAHWANVSELRKDKKGINAQTFVIDVDEYGNGVIDDSNIRPWARPRDSQLYLAAKYGAYKPEKDMSVPHTLFDPFYPTPTTASQKSAAGCYSYLWDADGNCYPSNYFLATDGIRFAQGIQSIFTQQIREGEAVSLVTSSSAIVTEGSQQYLYQGKYLSASWSGDLRRLPVNYVPATGLTVGAPDGATPTTILREPDWPMSSASAAIPPRKVFTYNTAPSPTSTTLPFDWLILTPTQKALLNGSDDLGEARLHYLRGATNNESGAANPTGVFRSRPKTPSGVTNLLGDIVHSNPVYVGKPRADMQGVGYGTFASKYANRAPAVYVGANDGMLHAFSAELDKEYFAYIPNLIFAGLKDLTQPTYQHRAYVDGGIAVSEAQIGTNWKTVLASTMGAGAQGVFALDVSDPTNFSATNGAIWEFSDADDPDMGNMFAPPVIAKFVKSGAAGKVPTYEYFVVVASGMNNYANDGAVGSSPGGALFLLSLNKPADTPWARNANYFKFPIPTSAIVDTQKSGLSAPAVVVGGDGAVRFAYAGDLQGNLWRFAFPPTGDMAQIQPHLLFTAKDKTGAIQPITSAPTVAFAPESGYVVMVGTGKYLENTDLHSKEENSFYGIYDSLNPAYSVSDRTELEKRTLSGAVDAAQITVSGKDFAYSGKKVQKGWYFDFANGAKTGERSVTAGQLSFGRVLFNTLIPSDDACTPLSSGRSYSINTLTGLAGADGAATGALSNVGILSSPITFITKPKVVTGSTPDARGQKVVKQQYSIVNTGRTQDRASSSSTVTNAAADLTAGRLSWREIFNYKGLRDGQ